MELVARHLKANAGLIRDYFSVISGSAGRLVISLAYFVALANTLSIAEFGLFATASATGIVLSRLVSFGFVSPLSTVKPQLIGAYTGGFLAAVVVSLPIFILAAYLAHLVFFGSDLALGTFAVIVTAEALLWRSLEVVVIVNNGLNRYGRAAMLVIIGTALRAIPAVLFAFSTVTTLAAWSWWYAGANGLALVIAVLFFYPKVRLRPKPAASPSSTRRAICLSAAMCWRRCRFRFSTSPSTSWAAAIPISSAEAWSRVSPSPGAQKRRFMKPFQPGGSRPTGFEIGRCAMG
jgi:O-antigen/teichoic acid export membrane protein